MSNPSAVSVQEISDIETALQSAKHSNRRFWVFSLVWAAIMVLVSIGFGYSISQFSDTRDELDNLKTESQKEIAELKNQIESGKRQLNETKKDTNKALEEFQTWTRNLFNELNDQLDILKERTAILEATRTTGRTGLTDAELDAIRIRQTVIDIPRRENSTRDWRKLTFTVSVDGSAEQAKKVVGNIEEVVYHFEPRWYKNPSRSRANSSDLFKLSVDVWGSTKVEVEIRIRGREAPIRRLVWMNLTDTEPQFSACGTGGIKYKCLVPG